VRALIVGVTAFFAGALTTALCTASAAEDTDADYRSLAVFARAYQHIESAWVGDVAPDALAYAAIRGMVGTLDGHSRFYDPAEAAKAIEVARAQDAAVKHVTVRHEKLEGKIGYLAIASFRDSTPGEVDKAMAQLRPLEGLVLDLRDDTGGLLQAAVRVADLWISDGIIVSTRAKNRSPEVVLAHPKGTEPGYPLIVLVNERTASAAEVLAAALLEHQRARLIGAPTYGKGSVQTVIELEDHSALKLTIARYYTPSGRSLEGQGLVPDVNVPTPVEPTAKTSDDPAVRRAIEAIRETSGRSFTAPKPRAISNP